MAPEFLIFFFMQHHADQTACSFCTLSLSLGLLGVGEVHVCVCVYVCVHVRVLMHACMHVLAHIFLQTGTKCGQGRL